MELLSKYQNNILLLILHRKFIFKEYCNTINKYENIDAILICRYFYLQKETNLLNLNVFSIFWIILIYANGFLDSHKT